MGLCLGSLCSIREQEWAAGGQWSDESGAGPTGPSCGMRRPPAGKPRKVGLEFRLHWRVFSLGGGWWDLHFPRIAPAAQWTLKDWGRETSGVWAEDSGAVLVAPRWWWPPGSGGLACREVLCAQAQCEGPAGARGVRSCVSGVPSPVHFQKKCQLKPHKAVEGLRLATGITSPE